MYIETVLADSPVEFFELSSQPAGTSGNTFATVPLSSSIANSLVVDSGGLQVPFVYTGNLFDKHTIEFLVSPGSSTVTPLAEVISNVVISAARTTGQTRVVVDNTNIWPGYSVSGTGIPAGATVVSKQNDSAETKVIELSAPVTTTTTGNLTFTPPAGSSIKITNGVITATVVTYSNSERQSFVVSAPLPTKSSSHIAVSFGQELAVFVNGIVVTKKPVARLPWSPAIASYLCSSSSGSAYMAALAVYKGAKTEQFAKKHSDAVWAVRGELNFADDVLAFSNESATKVNELSAPAVTPWKDMVTKGLVIGDRVELAPYSGFKLQPTSSGAFVANELDCSTGGVVFEDIQTLSTEGLAVKFDFRLLDSQDSVLPLFVAESSSASVVVSIDQTDVDFIELRFTAGNGETVASSIDVSGYVGLYSNLFTMTVVLNNDTSQIFIGSDSAEINHSPFSPVTLYVGSYQESAAMTRLSAIKVCAWLDDFVLAEFLSGSLHDTFVAPLTSSDSYTQYGYLTTTFVCNQITNELVDGSSHTGQVSWEPEGAPVVVEVASQQVSCGYRPAAWAASLPDESEVKVQFVYSSIDQTPVFLDSLLVGVYDYDSQQFSTNADTVSITEPDSIHTNETIDASFGGLVLTTGYCRYAPDTSSHNKVSDWSFADITQWTLPGTNHELVNDPTISTGYGLSFDISASGSVLYSTKMPVAPSKTHQLYLYVRPTAPISVTPKIAWYNGATLLSTTTGSTVLTTSLAPQTVPLEATSPATATGATIEFVVAPSVATNVLLDTVIFSQGSYVPELQDFRLDTSYETLSFVVKKHPVTAATSQYVFHHSDGVTSAYLRLSSAGAIEQSGLDSIMLNGVTVTAGDELINDAWNHITVTTSKPRCITSQEYLSLFSDASGTNNGRFLVDEVRLFRQKLTTEQQEDVYKSYVGSFLIDMTDSLTIPLIGADSCSLVSRPWVTP